MKLDKRLSSLEERAPRPRYTARTFHGIDMPAQLHIHDSEGHTILTFPNEQALDAYTRAEGICNVYKVRRAIAK